MIFKRFFLYLYIMKVIKLKESDLVGAIKNVLNEQGTTTRCDYKNWQNGDGKSKPKITLTQGATGVNATYQGPETGFCIQHSKGSTGDSIHQLAGVVSVTVSPLLKQLYGQGVFVKPDLKKIQMIKRDNFFQIYIPFIQTTEDKAITNFNERGGWGHDGANSLTQFIQTINNPQYGLIEKETKVASGGSSPDITENWVSFRDLNVYPIKTKQTTQQSAPKQQTQTQGGQDIASIIELSENASTSLRLKSPLAAGKYFEFMIQNDTFGCTWRNTINAPYSDDNMRLQVSNKGGKLTLIIVTGDGKKVEMRADGTSCKKL